MTDIFLSYGREDDEPFVKRLYEDLNCRGFSVWWDRVNMPSRALTFLQEIRDAVEASGRLIAVIGPHAVKSDYVRAEWEHAFLFCKGVIPILRKGPFGDKRDYEIVPDDLAMLHCPDFRESRPYEAALQELLDKLAEPVPPLGPLRNEIPALPPHFLPRREDLSGLSATVLADIQRPTVITSAKQTAALIGMGGIGKSVLAAAFARSTETRRACTDGIVWLPIDQTPDLLQKIKVVGSVFNDSLANYADETMARGQLAKLLADKVCLLVLDNVWDLRHVEPFKNAIGPRCRLLITTRDGSLATALGAEEHRLDVLSDAQALKLLAEWAGKDVTTLPAEAQDVATECGNLPLALSMCGAMICNKNTWIDLRDALREADLSYIESRLPNYPYPDMLKSLQVSMDFLERQDPTAAELYRELVVFHPADPVPEAAIMTLWTRSKRMSERDARKKLAKLENLALLRLHGESPQRLMTLHDLQRDYLSATTDNMQERHATLLDAYREHCPNGWHTGPNDGYFFQHLAYHLAETNNYDELRSLFADQNWMNARVPADGWVYDGYVADLTVAWEMADGKVAEDEAYFTDCFRYVLIRTSINSLAANYVPELVVAAVGSGLWSSERALSVAGKMPSREKASTLYTLLLGSDTLTEAQRVIAEKRAYDAALGINEETLQVKALAAVAEQLSGAQKATTLCTALDIALSIDNVKWRVEALAAVVGHLNSMEHSTAISKILDAALAIGNEGWRARALAAVVGQLNSMENATAIRKVLEATLSIRDKESQAHVLIAVAERVSDAEKSAICNKALDAVLAIGDEESRSSYLDAVASQLSGAENATSLSKALDAVIAIKDKGSKAHVLATVVKQLSGTEKTTALRKALDSALSIKDDESRADALATVAEQLSGADKTAVLSKALDSALSIKDDESRVGALASVAKQLGGAEKITVLSKALNATLAIRDEKSRAHALATVAEQLSGSEKTTLSKVLEAAFTIDDVESRSVALAAVAKYLSGVENATSLGKALDSALAINDHWSYKTTLVTLNGQMSSNNSETALAIAIRDALIKKDKKLQTEPLATAIGNVKCADVPIDVSKALDATLAFKDEYSQTLSLAANAEQLNGGDKQIILRQALYTALKIKDEDSRVNALTTVAGQLSGEEKSTALSQALDAAYAIKDKELKAHALTTVAGQLSGEEKAKTISKAFDTTFTIEDQLSRTKVQARLLTRLEASTANEQLSRILHSYKKMKRSDFMNVCSELPNLFHRKEIIKNIAKTIDDICTSWKWL
ncbi:MAG: toll/interleukin-1 receptor domain-containing protein [Desulfuromonadales bacterium]|nr:MAG: toll/interleukin-1 receptor domain-containing protein [Desulfuromonadales bacterium]